MYASAKYLIHADVRTNGVVERSDVVGAIFGQTEGLLGDQLDLRQLQDSSKVGRIDVSIDSEGGRSFGTITIATSLDRAETAVLAAALESIERVGPCRADCEVTHIEDARAAKRRELIDRATQLLADVEETTVTSEQIVEAVRQQARVEEITRYEGFPAGPRVESSDAIIIVEGRADVRRLLKYGIQNAVAVEGTNIPEEVAALTFERNTTAFLDGDRGGDLILRELQQVADVDYVAFAPEGESVEDLDRRAILSALRRKVPLDQVETGTTPRETFAPPTDDTDTDPPELSGTAPKPAAESADETPAENPDTGVEETVPLTDGDSAVIEDTPAEPTNTAGSSATLDDSDPMPAGEPAPSAETDSDSSSVAVTDVKVTTPETLAGHVEAVITGGLKTARLLDDSVDIIDEVDASDAFDAIADCETVPESVVIDGILTQRVLDIAAQRGVAQVVATKTGELVKQPTNVRIRTAAQFEI